MSRSTNKTAFSDMEQADEQDPSRQTYAGKQDAPAMSPQQQRFSKRGGKGLATYRNLMVADRGWLSLLGYELYNIAFAWIPGILGYGTRSALLRFFAKSYGKGTMIGRNVLIRQPSRVTFGKGVIVDDYVVLDLRDKKDRQTPSIELGDYAFVGRHSSIIAKGGQIKLGNACNISSQCRIATESTIEIGDSVLIAAYVYIGPANHSRDDDGRVQIEEEIVTGAGVKIGSGAWIGARATILDGVTIGKNAIVGAHSLVKDDVPDGAVVAGTPAKIIS